MRFVKIISNWWSFHRISRSSARGHRPRPWPRLLHVPEALYPHFSLESAHFQWSWGHFHLLTLELGFTPAVTFEATGHYLRSSPSIPWEILRPVWVPSMSVAVDPIFLILIQAQWKWILGTSDWRVNASLSLEVLGVCGLLQGQSRHCVGSSPSPP